MESQGYRVTKTILSEQIKVKTSHGNMIKTCFKITLIRIVWLCHKNKYSPWERIKNSGANLHIYNQMIYNKGAKPNNEKIDYSASGVRKTEHPHRNREI